MEYIQLHMGKELRCSVSAGKLRIHRDRTRTALSHGNQNHIPVFTHC